MFFGIDKDKIIKKSILVVSANSSRLNLITEHLTVRGLDVKSANKSFNYLTPSDLDRSIEAVVIDLETINNVEHTLDFICKILPKDITCVIFANNDSIKIREEFLNRGLRYLHFETQFNHLYSELDGQSGIGVQNARSINISVLGTKGGIGTSFISYQLANIIYQRYRTKVLLVQGVYSSFNIDIFADRNFSLMDYRENDLSLYKETEIGAYGFDKFANDKFNFIVYDHSIQSLDKDAIEHCLNCSDCVVLVINNELTSIRKAKEVLSSNEFLLSVNQGSKKLVLSLNELPNSKTLTKTEICEILKTDIDLVVPFHSNIKEIKNLSKGKTHRALQELSSLVIGQGANRQSGFKSLFKSSR